MKNEDLISVAEFCENQGIEFSFINSLQEFGLLKIITLENDQFIAAKELPRLRQILGFNQELEVSMGEFEVIINLLGRVRQIQHEMKILESKFHLCEN